MTTDVAVEIAKRIMIAKAAFLFLEKFILSFFSFFGER
jgi:hypothetical protein